MSNKPKVKKNINAKAKEEKAAAVETKQERKERRAKAQNNAAANRNKAKKAKAQDKQNGKKRNGIIEYFKGVRLEMRKVVWPTKKEMGSFTVIVLATCAAFALVFWGVDSGVLAAIKAVCF